MRNLMLTVLLSTPLLIGGCKKEQEPEALPATPPVSAEVGEGRFDGPTGGSGTLAFPIRVTNNTAEGIELDSLALRVQNAGEVVCQSRTSRGARLKPGETDEVIVEIGDCNYRQLGAPNVHVVGDVVFQRGGERRTRPVDFTVNLAQ